MIAEVGWVARNHSLENADNALSVLLVHEACIQNSEASEGSKDESCVSISGGVKHVVMDAPNATDSQHVTDLFSCDGFCCCDGSVVDTHVSDPHGLGMASMLASLRAEKTLSVAEEKHRRGSAETPTLDPSTVREVN